MKASQQSKRNKAKCGILRPESTTFSQDNNSDSNVEDVVETFPKPSPWFDGICHPAFPSPEPVSKLRKSVADLGRTKKSISETLPQKYVDHLPGTAGQREKKILIGQVEDSPGKYPNVKNWLSQWEWESWEICYIVPPSQLCPHSISTCFSICNELRVHKKDLSRELDLEMITEEEQEKLEDENNHAQVEEEKKHKSSEVEISENICDAADESGLFQRRKSGGNSNQEFPAMPNEGSDRFTLKQEEENRRNAEMFYEKMREHLRRKEDQYSKEVEVKQHLELTFQAVEVKVKTERNNLNQCEQTKDLLHKKHMLQEEIAMLRLEIDALKNQHREKEENYFEDIEILKVKNDDLQKAIKLNEETLTKTISHYTGQLNALTAENMLLNSKLVNKKESKQRLEMEVKSYRSRLGVALHDQGQTSKRDLELAFQRARDEWLCLWDKMKYDVANLKDNKETLSQQLSTVKNIFKKLKIKLHHARDDLREKTLMLERVQRDLSQSEFQKQEIEHMYQNEQGKVNTYLGNQESLEERLPQLQSENMLLHSNWEPTVKRRWSLASKTSFSGS
ncbi:hypothetical protein E5288_WYG011449 [Bos mutus]|uniref:CCDC144C-like coiled-coil domain-containing protein n=1 Tax=Bos mutus TaxID=72004 RepID=A0A6B0SAD5_9CETA|nr:hypothetical protein [Bos mutus]